MPLWFSGAWIARDRERARRPDVRSDTKLSRMFATRGFYPGHPDVRSGSDVVTGAAFVDFMGIGASLNFVGDAWL